jgi:hypothetical protein
MAHNVSAKPDARRQARVPKAKARSAAGFACYVKSRDGRRRVLGVVPNATDVL